MAGLLRTQDGEEHNVGEVLPPIECFRCGVCCVKYQPPVMPEEIEKVAAGLGISGEEFLARYGQSTYAGNLVRRSQGQCVFLGWEEGGLAACKIHDSRPEACRNWVASLARRECREGLARLKARGKLILPGELHLTQREMEQLSGDDHPD